jgi:hypothetical protein
VFSIPYHPGSLTLQTLCRIYVTCNILLGRTLARRNRKHLRNHPVNLLRSGGSPLLLKEVPSSEIQLARTRTKSFGRIPEDRMICGATSVNSIQQL